MKYNGVSFKGMWPRVRAKKVYRKLARKQERRYAKKELSSISSMVEQMADNCPT